MSLEELQTHLEHRRKLCPYKSDKDLLVGMFPEKLIKILTSQPDLLHGIKMFPLDIIGSMPYEQAQVCSGGVSTAEINFETMESTLQEGLYFAGEILDIDGICGGYNLQWAWSSGAIAGKYAAVKH